VPDDAPTPPHKLRELPEEVRIQADLMWRHDAPFFSRVGWLAPIAFLLALDHRTRA